MSINRMTDEALKEDWRVQPPPRVQKLVRGVGGYGPGVSQQLGHEKALAGNGISNALEMLIRYIPTEAVTLYVAVLAAAPSVRAAIPEFAAETIYWAFVILSPFLVLAIYASKRAAEGMDPLPVARNWPWWEMFAATVGMAAWGLAVPGNPYSDGAAMGTLAAVLVLFSSTLLSVLEPLVRQRLQRWRAAAV
ncbi:MAG: hypothetical protein R3272_13315 [Candidatus Promineifilaceae bacterium]|nr:hypothetical protein [Candidatus Promineifilaceae bacterium]